MFHCDLLRLKGGSETSSWLKMLKTIKMSTGMSWSRTPRPLWQFWDKSRMFFRNKYMKIRRHLISSLIFRLVIMVSRSATDVSLRKAAAEKHVENLLRCHISCKWGQFLKMFQNCDDLDTYLRSLSNSHIRSRHFCDATTTRIEQRHRHFRTCRTVRAFSYRLARHRRYLLLKNTCDESFWKIEFKNNMILGYDCKSESFQILWIVLLIYSMKIKFMNFHNAKYLKSEPLNASVAPGARFLSGWNCRANFRYCFFSSTSVNSLVTLSIS